jgi:AraC-like DNA-binding protein
LKDLAVDSARERARFLRFEDRPWLEVLHATFVRHRYALHTHPTFTIALVEEGAAAFELGGHRYVAPAGTVFVIPPGAAHTGRSATARGYTYKVLYVDPEHAAAALGAPPQRGRATADVVIDDPRLAAGLARVHRLLAGASGCLEGDESVTLSLATLGSLVAARPSPRSRRPHPAVSRARAYLEDHFTERVSLDDLARSAGVSPFHLTRTFHSELGMPPSTYQRQLRIELAKQRLRDGAPAARVAADCGFSDQPHLVREFKRVVGVTPGAFAASR